MSLSPYYNLEFTSFTSVTEPNLSTTLFTISTIYFLGNLWLIEKLRTEGNQWGSGNFHFSLHKDQKKSWKMSLVRHWLGGWRLTLSIIIYHIHQGNRYFTFFLSLSWLTELSAALDAWQGSCENNPNLIPGLLCVPAFYYKRETDEYAEWALEYREPRVFQILWLLI